MSQNSILARIFDLCQRLWQGLQGLLTSGKDYKDKSCPCKEKQRTRIRFHPCTNVGKSAWWTAWKNLYFSWGIITFGVKVRGGTGSLFLIFPCKDNFCPCYPCQRSKILVILARASGRGQKSWPEWYSGTFCLWKWWIDDNAVYLFINCDSWWKQTR